MKTCLFIFPALGLLIGCGGSKESASPTATKTPAPKAPLAAMPALAPAHAGTAPSAAPSPATAPPPAVDLATAMRPLDANGNPISDLDMLNQAIIQYGGRALGGGNIPTAEGVQGVDAINAALVRPAPAQLKDLSELVKAGLIKALPVPPPGKAYVLDPKTRMAALVDKK